jgi:hypothetical protein
MRKLLLLFCFGLLTALGWAQSTTSGSLTAAGSTCTSTAICVTLPLSPSAGAVGLSITGTWSATLQFEGSSDNGVSFVAISGFPLNSTTGASNTTSNGTWRFAVSGLTHIRVRCSAFTSGTAAIVINSSPTAASLNQGGGGGGGSGTVTDFTAGDLSPLFTSSVATSSSTPALTFSLTAAGANTVFGNATGSSGAPSYGKIVNGQITNSTIDLTAKVTGILPVANGGTGTATPGLVQGANVTITGTWPNQTIAASGGGGSGCTTSGSAGNVLTDDGAGGCTSNTGLNYDSGTGLTVGGASTAILPATAAAGDIGSATLPFQYLWFAGSSGTPGTNNFKLIGASTSGTRTATFPNANTLIPIATQTLTFAGPTSARTITFPDASITVARTDAANTFTGTQTFGTVVGTTWNGNTWATGTGTLAIGAGKTATVSNTLTFTGTDASSVVFGAGGTVLYSGTRRWSCQPGIGDGTNAVTAATYLESICYNDTGSTVTITGLKCFTDNSGTSTMNAAGNTLGALLTGAVTCSTSFAAGTQSANVALTAGDYIKFTWVLDGTSKQLTTVVTGTY